MVKGKASYEELRRQRLEENNRRLEDLNLAQLARKLLNSSPKPSPTKQAKPRTPRKQVEGLVQVRRSSRIENKPAPVYREVPADLVKRPRRYHERRHLLSGVYASDEARLNAMVRAEALKSSLENENDFPGFVKPMVGSHVTGCFWLGLPAQFCKDHLPKGTETMWPVDENGDEFPTVYIAKRTGLSGGWKGFSLAHALIDGDALLFQLVKPTQFKVYIIRAND